MSKRVIAFVLMLISLIINTFAYDYATTEDYIPSSKNKETLIILMEEELNNMENAHILAEAARELGYEEEHPIIVLAKNEWETANFFYIGYLNEYNYIIEQEQKNIWYQKSKEYPVATEIWLYLKELGYSDYVCAGIIGNMMSEAGGQTLNIQWDIYNSSKRYYGICQWGPHYKEVWDTDLKYQCDYLANSIKYNLDTFGYAYKKNFNFESFLALTDEKEVALAFAKCYERCAKESYNIRQKNATKALKYFTGNIEE